MRRKSPITEKAEKRIAQQEAHVQKIYDLCNKISTNKQMDQGKQMFDESEIDLIGRALMAHASVITLDVKRQQAALENGSEDGNLLSHSEKEILRGCLGLLEEAGGEFREYLEYIGVDPDEDEESRLEISMTYGHIVNRLFLWNTTHSGGTSTAAKCRELGVDYYESVDITQEEEE